MHRSALLVPTAAFICLLCGLIICRCACKCISAFMNTFMCLCASPTQCAALPHQPSSGRPNIAQKRQLLPLLSCLAPIPSIIPHSAAHIHPFFPCLFSKDIPLAKYMQTIIFHCKSFKDTSQEWLAHYTKTRQIRQTLYRCPHSESVRED